MAAYTGSGNFPYWMTIINTGAQATPAAISENVPVQVGQTYQCEVIASYATTYAPGMQVFFQWYNANGSLLSQTSLITQTNMTGGVLYAVNTATQTAPANASYLLAWVQCLGTPLETNPLQVFQVQVTDGNGATVNVNTAFTYTFWPWTASTGSPTLAWNGSPLLPGDSDSLVIDNIIELMGGIQGVPSTVPELLDSNGQGPTYRILAPPSLNSQGLGYQSSYDLNAPQPTQDVVASMLLDGERPFGERASNRTISLPIVIFGTQAGGMAQVLKAREYLISLVDQQTYTIKWTAADTGLPMLFDCFRALPSNPVYGFNYSSGGTATGQTIGRPNYPIGMITLEIQALPYGRSDIDGIQNLAFASPIVGGINPQTVSASTLDTFSSVLAAPPVISNPLVTSMGFNNPTSVSTWNITTSGSIGAGNTSIVTVQGASATVSSVTDTQGNVYSPITSQSSGGGSLYSMWYAPVVNPLGATDHVSITMSGSGNFTSNWISISGAYTPTVQYHNSQTAATFSQTFNANEYDFIVYVASGLGSAGSVPTGFNFQNNFGNGFNNVFCWYSEPINQTSVTISSNSLPNPSAIMVIDFVPMNKFWNLDTVTAPSTFVGHSVRYTPPRPFRTPYPAAAYNHTLSSPVSIVGNPVMSVYFGQAYDPDWPKDPKFISSVLFQWQLTDDLGRTLNFSKKQKAVPYGTHPSTPKWSMINVAIPQGKAFNYNSVMSYTLRISNWYSSGHTGYIRMHCWLNNVVANPQTIQNSPSPRGAVYQMLGLPGSARAPVSVQCQLPAAQNITKEITTPSTGNWIVPPGVYSVQAEAWGGGGAGAAANLTRTLFGGGGGGAEYAQEPSLSVVPGQQVPWSLGAGGTPGQLQNTVVQYNRAGLGHWTCPPNVTNILAEVWGGGGAGGAGAGGGGGAEYAYANIPVTPGTTYSLWTGAGGKADTGTSAAQIAARNGTTSWFGPPGNGSPLSSYVRASGGFTSLTGSSSGGLGGTSGATNTPTVLNRTGFTVPSGTPSTATIVSQSPNNMITLGNTALVVLQTNVSVSATVKDSSGNHYTFIGSTSNTGAFAYAFTCENAKAMSRRGTVTVTMSGGANVMALLYDVPGIISLDVPGVATSGTGTTVSITSGTANYANDAVIAIVSSQPNGLNGTGTNAAGFTYGSASFNPNVSPVLNIGIGEVIAPTTAGITANPTFASSTAWSAMIFTFRSVSRFSGGRGGTSPGPSGGGGGGAAGAAGIGGVGGNSQPFTGTSHWQTGGAGGAGSGAGGNGGAGAPTPGFPVVGTAPGGGGGGGYQTAPVFNPANPSVLLPGQKQTNFLGADGGVGMVQLTYAVGAGNPVNGGNTSFGSAGTTGTVLTAHGGGSAANNSATGGAAGTGSSNTIHNNGGVGGFNYETAVSPFRGSYFSGIFSGGLLTTLNTATWNQAGGVLGTSAASIPQGVAIALVASAAKVTDWVVTDSAGNIYQLQGGPQQAQGTSGITLYAYVADVEYPITTSTTLSVLSATSQQVGVIWYGSAFLAAGVTAGNSASAFGTSSTAAGTFGIGDTQSIQMELGAVICDTSRTVSSVSHGGFSWFNAGATNTVSWNATCQLAAFVAQNQGGGTGAANSGDIFTANLSGSANWAVLCIPLTVINQQSNPILVSGYSGTTPGSQTAWSNNGLNLSANGMMVVAGTCGSGAGITAGPTAFSDGQGNHYTFQKTQILPSNGGTIWVATAPVTAAIPATAAGTINWGTASAAPNYAFDLLWVPNASGVDGTSSITGNGATVSGIFTPSAANDFVLVHNVAVSSSNGYGGWTSSYNWVMNPGRSYLTSQGYAVQAIDMVCPNFTAGISTAMPWATIMLGLTMNAVGTGGGAAGGSGGPGYNGVWAFGGPGYTGGGKGGQGAAPPPQAGNGASYPGGGGGGCLGVSGTPYEGGQGAPGAIRLTWTPPLQPFNTLIVHSLGANSDPNVNPVTPIPITDIPNNTEYLVPSLNGVLNATFNSTYSVILSNAYWNSITSSTPRQITVTINQYEYPGGPKYSVQVSRAVTPATDSVNGLLSMGEVTLPVKDYLKYNDQSYFTVSINDTDTSDRFQDVLMLDTLGQTALINIDPGQQGFGQYINFFIDEANSERDLGFVGATMQDRQHQISVLDYAQLSGPGMYIGPGDNLFMVYSPAGAPSLSLQYAPRWYLDRSA